MVKKTYKRTRLYGDSRLDLLVVKEIERVLFGGYVTTASGRGALVSLPRQVCDQNLPFTCITLQGMFDGILKGISKTHLRNDIEI